MICSANAAAEDWTLNSMFKPETKTNKIVAHQRYGLKCKFSPDSKFLVTTSADQTAKLWDTTNQEFISVSTIFHADMVYNALNKKIGNHIDRGDGSGGAGGAYAPPAFANLI